MQLHQPDGRFITFEGGEGSGKSTQAGILANRLARAGRKVFSTREPGGTPAAEEIREALLSGRVWQFGPFAEALMFAVARADHLEGAIGQALHEGKWVVCDRFLDSTRAYQGATSGEDRDLALHEVRKSAKRLRYAVETAQPAFGKRATKLAARAEALQELLGDHQDSVVSRATLREIGARAHEAGQNTFTFGLLHAVEACRAAVLEERYAELLAALPRKDLGVWLRR